MGDGETESLHALLHVVHLRLYAVFVLEQILQLKMLENFENDLALFFT